MISAVLLAVSCNNAMIEDPIQYGTLSVSLAGEPGVEVVTRGTELSADKAKNYDLAVYDNPDCSGTPVSGPVKYSEVNGGFILPEDTYYVWAQSCSPGVAETGNGCMRLVGKSNAVEVKTDITNSAVVECEVANARVTVAFDSSVAENFENESLTVTLTQGKSNPNRILTATNTGTNTTTEFWFNHGSVVTYSISGTTRDGKTVSGSGCINKSSDTGNPIPFVSKDDYCLNVSVKQSSDGTLSLSPSVNTTVEKGDDITAGFNPYK